MGPSWRGGRGRLELPYMGPHAWVLVALFGLSCLMRIWAASYGFELWVRHYAALARAGA